MFNLVTFLLFGIWALCLISADENNFVPSWARISGQGAAYLIIVAQIGILFGLIPAACFCSIIFTWWSGFISNLYLGNKYSF